MIVSVCTCQRVCAPLSMRGIGGSPHTSLPFLFLLDTAILHLLTSSSSSATSGCARVIALTDLAFGRGVCRALHFMADTR